jgi:hypothetical protein
MAHNVIREQKMMDRGCAMISTFANMFNLHVSTAEDSGCFEVYTRVHNHAQWVDFIRTFHSDAAAEWHGTVGDLCGGILIRLIAQGSWPRIADLFQTGVEHQFTVISREAALHWFRAQSQRFSASSGPFQA